MKAAVYKRYGGPEVVKLTDIPKPTAAKGEVLVSVMAAGVNTGDWRLRAAAFPGLLMTLAGRLMFGVTGPRKPVLGSEFAGLVEAVGEGVTTFTPGDRVLGFSNGGAHAEYLTMKADGAVTHLPEALSFAEGAALPFGGLAALEFLDRFAGLKPGEHVLIIGASGGVGAYAVQVAKAFGAEVTAVASAAREGFLKDLGADHTIDYHATPLGRIEGTFDVVFDTIGVSRYDSVAPRLRPGGRFVPLNFNLPDLWAKRRAKRAGHQVVLQVNGDTKEGLERLVALIEAGQVRPVVDTVLPFSRVQDAYRKVETRHRAGAVVLKMGEVVSEQA